ncbi:hypothetical protein QR685DRAFT_321760 [Neurospora intermedia]|uniref:Questionable protein n=1 Tax=Neurospora intermedia TaxID=5142 RepID=A0ABR3D8I1_NEUIN
MRTRRLRYGHEYNVVDIDPYGCTRKAVPSERQKRVLVEVLFMYVLIPLAIEYYFAAAPVHKSERKNPKHGNLINPHIHATDIPYMTRLEGVGNSLYASKTTGQKLEASITPA